MKIIKTNTGYTLIEVIVSVLIISMIALFFMTILLSLSGIYHKNISDNKELNSLESALCGISNPSVSVSSSHSSDLVITDFRTDLYSKTDWVFPIQCKEYILTTDLGSKYKVISLEK